MTSELNSSVIERALERKPGDLGLSDPLLALIVQLLAMPLPSLGLSLIKYKTKGVD